ncbi:MAG TPA: DNA-formamidopyrimidine glycosylase family protein [Actinomycetota bacterium]|nr:DNA-formamidopyrimidine glycosylase family protein [Actinomycetota bacterium]
MPELPEIQALAERLDALLAGAPLERVEPLHVSGLRTVAPRPAEVEGRTVRRVGRRGKFLILDLGGPRVLVHLAQGGRVEIEDPPRATRPRGALVRFRFHGRPSVLVREFGTERRAGWWVLAEGDEGPLRGLGPEPFDEAFAALVRAGGDGRRVHTILRDQRAVAGIGRGYADDILHRARLSPYATLAGLGAEEREALLAAVREVLAGALEAERRRTGGLPPKLGDRFAVHGRHGHPCPRCGDDLRRVSYEAYEVTYCPRCQTGGKVLADRRLSRLVR